MTEHPTTARSNAVLAEIGRTVVGKGEALSLIMLSVLAGGHVLIEDLPGLGKTLIARSFAAALGLDFTRVQFTPDLLPADLLGSTIYDMSSGHFEFRPGPIFTDLLMADEINRTPPKTQAALLEAMAEGQVSIDGRTSPNGSPTVLQTWWSSSTPIRSRPGLRRRRWSEQFAVRRKWCSRRCNEVTVPVYWRWVRLRDGSGQTSAADSSIVSWTRCSAWATSSSAPQELSRHERRCRQGPSWSRSRHSSTSNSPLP